MKKLICLLVALFTFWFVHTLDAEAAYPTYTINSSSNPMDKTMLKYSTYNTYTKQYYVLRSYLEELEKKGGGTLILNSGTYTITNTLYVPSNVTLRFKNGVKIVKGTVTGTSQFGAAKSVFQFIRPSRSGKTGVYGKYDGEKNISFIGEGKVLFDMKYLKDGIAIIAGHNQNIKIENIEFHNMQSGHFIEMDATYKAVIKNNEFIDSKASVNKNKEAINLDTPDKVTQGWSQKWSKYDKTPNKNVIIEGNTFKNLDRAIGTHKYSEGKYHDGVVIRKNLIDKTRRDSIRAMNWSNSIIEGNTFRNIEKTGNYSGILASGVKNPMFKNNIFDNMPRPIQIFPWKNSGPGSVYAVTYNTISSLNISALSTNKVRNTTETFIRINSVYNEYTKNTIKVNCIAY
ncbi:right-handed parallel beta-helix repeat-containing protein [Peribacillus deserti]|uniref:Right-handed parallel beta-helix repeat-containing protein n=1 Tax=Peribacillus deserti TaxID=673318 RepID=A0A2N5MBX0_9BACI|nr:right-handed parallel beta-helix repeat-containing protein [Peribacillus deserti]PLT31833.1 right-handed parallel beta-helix repeat-containing protein [Peribacillus deserti]